MPTSTFDFKQFTIHQELCAMKVGTDSVLLGALATLSATTEEAHVLDIGTGTGILSLMMAQRYEEAGIATHIDAIEIDPEAARQAASNCSQSRWSHAILVHPMSLQQFADQEKEDDREKRLYSLIISNPPFYNATLKPENQERAVARHCDSLPVSEIASYAKAHLTPEGRLSLVYPTAYDSEVMTATILNGLQPVRIIDILTKEGKPCKRRVAEIARQGAPLSRETLSILDKEGHYTTEYRLLTEPFYLRLKE